MWKEGSDHWRYGTEVKKHNLRLVNAWVKRSKEGRVQAAIWRIHRNEAFGNCEAVI